MEFIKEAAQEVFKYIINPEFAHPVFFGIWQTLRIIFLLVSVFLIGLLAYVLSVNGYLEMRFTENYSELRRTKPHFNVKLGKRWGEVVKQAKDNKEAERKLAVIEADDTVDDVLARIGYEGETLIEKIEGLNKEIIPNIEEIREAHKMRRDISYDPNKSLSKEEAERIIAIYEQAFKDLHIF